MSDDEVFDADSHYVIDQVDCLSDEDGPSDDEVEYDTRSEASNSSASDCSRSRVRERRKKSRSRSKSPRYLNYELSPRIKPTPTRSRSRSRSRSPVKKRREYDYATKLNYLFRGARFYIIKSVNVENIMISKSKGVWSTLPHNERKLNLAVKECRNVFLIFSVKESKKFSGFARVRAQSRRDLPPVAWVLPKTLDPKILQGVFEVDWVTKSDLSFSLTTHLHNNWNEGKPVKIARDGQEIEPKVAEQLCRLFPEDPEIDLMPVLRASKQQGRVVACRTASAPIPEPNRNFQKPGIRARGGKGGFFRYPVQPRYPYPFVMSYPSLPYPPPRYYDGPLPPSPMPEYRDYDRSVEEFLHRTRDPKPERRREVKEQRLYLREHREDRDRREHREYRERDHRAENRDRRHRK